MSNTSFKGVAIRVGLYIVVSMMLFIANSYVCQAIFDAMDSSRNLTVEIRNWYNIFLLTNISLMIMLVVGPVMSYRYALRKSLPVLKISSAVAAILMVLFGCFFVMAFVLLLF